MSSIPTSLQDLSVPQVLDLWGLSLYQRKFEEEGIDGIPELLALSDEELKTDLQMKLGDRKRFQLAKNAADSNVQSTSSFESPVPTSYHPALHETVSTSQPPLTLSLKLFIFGTRSQQQTNMITVDVDPTDSISELKLKIGKQEDLSPELLKIKFAGKDLDNDQILSPYLTQKYLKITAVYHPSFASKPPRSSFTPTSTPPVPSISPSPSVLAPCSSSSPTVSSHLECLNSLDVPLQSSPMIARGLGDHSGAFGVVSSTPKTKTSASSPSIVHPGLDGPPRWLALIHISEPTRRS